MPRALRNLTATLALLALFKLGLLGCARPTAPTPVAYNAELEYLEAVHRNRTPREPLLVFLLTAEYLNSDRMDRGIRFLEELLAEREEQLLPAQRANLLNALGLLRAQEAPRVPLLRRNAWVKETIRLLEEARGLSEEDDALARFVAGTVFAQLPERFGKKEQAYQDLRWLLDHRREIPQPGFLREVHYQLARLYQLDGQGEESEKHLRQSGYPDFERETLLLTSFAANGETGHTFYPRRMREVVSGKVFALSGFEFTEYYFVISDDGRQLISIDAGSRPDAAEAAYRYLEQRHPKLPPLTTVFVTHAHWDHIGGQAFFRTLNPDAIFYARDNYQDELDLVAGTQMPFDYFFGTRYTNDLLVGYQPDVTVSEPTDLVIGGSRFTLIPVPGSETPDALFVHMPDEGVLFVGDFIMPYLGAPFFEEGSIEALFEAVEIAVSLQPEHLLHGHEPLSSIWSTPEGLADIRDHLVWLFELVTAEIMAGKSRAEIHRMNPIPPDLSEDESVQFGYLTLRENFINRVYDRDVGYWERDLTGMDTLSDADLGSIFVRYLGHPEAELAAAAGRMLEEGEFHLARRVARWALTQYPGSEPLKLLHRRAVLKLKEKYQFTSPFKFIVYSDVAEDPTPQLEVAENP